MRRTLAAGLTVLALALATLVLSAHVGALTADTTLRLILPIGATLLLPSAALLRLHVLAHRRRGARVGGPWLIAGWNLALLLLLCLGFSDSTGRALRRRGDWFLGQTEGAVADRLRRAIRATSERLERWDLPGEARSVLADASRPQPVEPAPTIPTRPTGSPAKPTAPPAAWYHPLAGPKRRLPRYATWRFGAARGRGRPPECGLGHCGVDLASPRGTPVHAVHDGVVQRVVRSETRGRGRFLVIAHRGGRVTSEYLHLDTIASSLAPGVHVRGEEVIATVGSSGLRRPAPHLHFGLTVRRGAAARYLDPEPLLRLWRLPEGGSAPALVRRP